VSLPPKEVVRLHPRAGVAGIGVANPTQSDVRSSGATIRLHAGPARRGFAGFSQPGQRLGRRDAGPNGPDVPTVAEDADSG